MVADQTPIKLILQAYAPAMNLTLGDQKRLQGELFEVQKRPEAWGLVIPFLQHPDPNVQFFGAHTIQVKITRDWQVFQPFIRLACNFEPFLGRLSPRETHYGFVISSWSLPPIRCLRNRADQYCGNSSLQ